MVGAVGQCMASGEPGATNIWLSNNAAKGGQKHEASGQRKMDQVILDEREPKNRRRRFMKADGRTRAQKFHPLVNVKE